VSITQWAKYDLMIIENTYFLSANSKVILSGLTKSDWHNGASGLS
jgi:hypothetical protein